MLNEIKKEIKCKNPNCDGTLHSVAPVYDMENPLLTRYKCKCNKCGQIVILDFDPDQK